MEDAHGSWSKLESPSPYPCDQSSNTWRTREANGNACRENRPQRLPASRYSTTAAVTTASSLASVPPCLVTELPLLVFLRKTTKLQTFEPERQSYSCNPNTIISSMNIPAHRCPWAAFAFVVFFFLTYYSASNYLFPCVETAHFYQPHIVSELEWRHAFHYPCLWEFLKCFFIGVMRNKMLFCFQWYQKQYY